MAGIQTEAAFVALTDEQLAEMAPFGTERAVTAGEILYDAGAEEYDFFVVLDGEVEIVRIDADRDVVIAVHEAGNFLGELNMFTGQRAFLTARVKRDGRLLVIPRAEFRHLMSAKPELSTIVFRAFVTRRDILRVGDGAGAILIIGSRYSPDALALRAFANRSRLVYRWIDLEDTDDPAGVLAPHGASEQDVPVAVLPNVVLRKPSPGEFAEALGMTFHAPPGYVCDLVVVGSGPAGLASAVYGASEGLDTVSIDAVALGGQAGASSRIENYAGFPNGIPGEALVQRAAVQAMRLGARLNAPCEAAGLRVEQGYHVVVLADGSEIAARAVIIASGARYRRLAVDDLERFEGAGVYYAATDMEARMCRGSDVVVVGGGNSAGQASIYLAQQTGHVTLVVRRDSLKETMSQYLIERIDADPRVTLRTRTEVRALAGEVHLDAATIEHADTGARTTIPCAGLFCFIGAEPATEWLDNCVLLDRKGFVLTDRALPESPEYAARDPLPFETSLPGVFAAGDVRDGSLKRVAAAVGEGSSAVRSVHEYLATIT